MRVLFLDIDGVLVFPKSAECVASRMTIMDRAAVERLNRIVEATGALIVISSTWRYNNRKGPRNPWKVLPQTGFRGGVIVGHTTLRHWKTSPVGIVEGALSRSDEIRLWLQEHPEVTSWVALDDEILDLPNHVKTTFAEGLQDRHVEEAIRLLISDAKVLVGACTGASCP